MARTAEALTMTYAEYLAAEAKSERKHEWLRGEVFAMAGGTPEHGRLAANVITQLQIGLRGRPCQPFTSDVRVRVQATDLTTYPDVTVVCGKLEISPDDPHAIINPIVLVEVLSDATEAYDRGEKFAHYRRIPTLREYVLVSQHERRIDVYRLNDAGHWELHEAVADVIDLTSINCPLSVDEVYANPLATG